ncbi:MAG: hypothetical protein H6Q14_2486 [Bacteroidetes bacterium]|nr:hypothetical protein [Bacteroidota bacterium]
MYCKNAFILFFVLLSIGMPPAQSVKSELRSDLWKTILPTHRGIPYSLPLDSLTDTIKTIQKEVSGDNDAAYYYRNFKKMDFLEKSYQRYKEACWIDELFPSKIDLNIYLNPPNQRILTLKYDFGHFYLATRCDNGGFSFDLFGGGPRKLSKKTKWILKNVYNVSDEELKGK